jgi:hypothetical protein
MVPKRTKKAWSGFANGNLIKDSRIADTVIPAKEES